MMRFLVAIGGLAGLVQAQTNNPTGAPSVIASPTAAPVPADVTHLNYVAVTTSVLGGLILFFTAIHCMRRLQAEELEALEKAKAEADEGKKKKEKAGD